MTKRSYYLLKDGKTITSEPPTVRYKSVARVANKKEAVKVFNARFEKRDGVYLERKPDATPRRVSIISSSPKVAAPKPGSKICFCIEEDCGCPRAGAQGDLVFKAFAAHQDDHPKMRAVHRLKPFMPLAGAGEG